MTENRGDTANDPTEGRRKATEAIADVERYLSSGNLIAAYSATRSASDDGIADIRMRYLEVLALARMGDTQQALAQYEYYKLIASDEADVLSLRGRILKDQALASTGNEQRDLLEHAAEAYRCAHENSKKYFPAVNAATLFATLGKFEQSRNLASLVLQHVDVNKGVGYWPLVTRAEALVLCGEYAAAKDAALAATVQTDVSNGNRSSTVKQFQRLLPMAGIDLKSIEPILTILRPAPVMHYCGHVFRDDGIIEREIIDDVKSAIDELGIEIAYGALAAGSDIVIAEYLIARGAELNVVLPLPTQDFIDASIAPAGAAWLERFQHCLEQAASVTITNQMPYVGDPSQFAYGATVAMGMAALRASNVATSPYPIGGMGRIRNFVLRGDVSRC